MKRAQVVAAVTLLVTACFSGALSYVLIESEHGTTAAIWTGLAGTFTIIFLCLFQWRVVLERSGLYGDLRSIIAYSTKSGSASWSSYGALLGATIGLPMLSYIAFKLNLTRNEALGCVLAFLFGMSLAAALIQFFVILVVYLLREVFGVKLEKR